MFCYQCEQTARSRRGDGCAHTVGTCGKDAVTADLQDLLIYLLKGVSMYAHRAAELGARDRGVDVFVIESLFTTLTNVNFDPARFEALIARATQMRDRARTCYEAACADAGRTPESLSGPAACDPGHALDQLLARAGDGAITVGLDRDGADVVGLRALVLYGIKGAAAYFEHAHVLEQDDPAIYAEFHRLLNFLAGNPSGVDDLLGRALEVGALNYRVMQRLDAAATERYGHPQPTVVRTTPRAGRAILVSGHDLRHLEQILEQTAGLGIDVYTHGELLPAHGYPNLRRFAHLAGNYGTAWQNQHTEFADFPGAIVMTSNCLIEPQPAYRARIFTSGPVGWADIPHIGDGDYRPVIDAALAAPGFATDAEPRHVTVGFARHSVLDAAPQVVEAVQSGALKHFFLIGGCDGARPGRNYYTELAEQVPQDCAILTLGCAKYRFNDQDFGDIGGLPRLLDVGQCNDSYSAIQIALALADAFDCGVNDLPLSLVLSWLEQKAVAVLLTLLHLGVRNIRLGPSLPAFLTPPVLQVLVDTFGLTPIGEPTADLDAMLSAA
ncbi:hydroxylamine reductase [Immundisolibacter sp.]|uniref:hydroxylamine reductase n=1 Tax=Immundisolibacter sp. TaxID=1934948 RepID=UPI003F827744